MGRVEIRVGIQVRHPTRTVNQLGRQGALAPAIRQPRRVAEHGLKNLRRRVDRLADAEKKAVVTVLEIQARRELMADLPQGGQRHIITKTGLVTRSLQLPRLEIARHIHIGAKDAQGVTPRQRHGVAGHMRAQPFKIRTRGKLIGEQVVLQPESLAPGEAGGKTVFAGLLAARVVITQRHLEGSPVVDAQKQIGLSEAPTRLEEWLDLAKGIPVQPVQVRIDIPGQDGLAFLLEQGLLQQQRVTESIRVGVAVFVLHPDLLQLRFEDHDLEHPAADILLLVQHIHQHVSLGVVKLDDFPLQLGHEPGVDGLLAVTKDDLFEFLAVEQAVRLGNLNGLASRHALHLEQGTIFENHHPEQEVHLLKIRRPDRLVRSRSGSGHGRGDGCGWLQQPAGLALHLAIQRRGRRGNLTQTRERSQPDHDAKAYSQFHQFK